MFKRIFLILSIVTSLFLISCGDKPTDIEKNNSLTPKVEDDTPEAKAFLSLLNNKTTAVSQNGAKYKIKDGGKTIYDDSNPKFMVEFKIQSAKDSKTAYYTMKYNRDTFVNYFINELSLLPANTVYYGYHFFQVDGNNLIEYTGGQSYQKRAVDFVDAHFDVDANNDFIKKSGIDYSKVDFTPMMVKKEEIDINTPVNTYTLQ